MNILMLSIGFGIGTLVTAMAVLIVLGQVTKPNEKDKERAMRTVDLLAERNAIDTKIEKHLQTLANWADNNWNMRP